MRTAAAFQERAIGEAAGALVLVAEGRTDRVRVLPFLAVPPEVRERAIAEGLEAGEGTWPTLALEALARTCRLKTQALTRAAGAMAPEDAMLDAWGRAAITARRALMHLRDGLALTVPWLAAELGLSRPAAGDAIERLANAGIAVEISGRSRDRVFAYAVALAVADA